MAIEDCFRWLLFGVLLVSAGLLPAQTSVTTSGGTAGTVPVFTSGSNIENSPITINGSTITAGTTGTPTNVHVTGVLSGGAVPSAAVLASYTYAQMQALGQVTLAGYNPGSQNGGGVFKWINRNNTRQLCLLRWF